MRQKVKDLFKHPLVYGSSIVIIGNLIANFFNFIFNLFMSRSLSLADYGILASVMALISFPNLMSGAIVPVVVKFAGQYFAVGQLEMVRGLYVKIAKFLSSIGIVVCLFFLLLMPQVGAFFHIKDPQILFITDIIIFLAFIGIINNALLQAKMAFVFQVFVSILGAVLKLVVGFVLVWYGFAVGGAVMAILIAAIIAYIITFIPIKFVFDKKILFPKLNSASLFSYGIPSALTVIGLTFFISTDIILVKHFFNPNEAGLYAGLSLIGKVIFYVSAPIGTVMFPLIVKKHAMKEDFTNTFKFSLVLVFLPSLLLSAFYYLFPTFTVQFFLKNKEYLSISPLLWIYGIYMSLYSVLSIVLNFYLSIKKTNVFIPVLIAAMMQIVILTIFHQTFYQIICLSLIIIFVLVLSLLLYYPYATKR